MSRPRILGILVTQGSLVPQTKALYLENYERLLTICDHVSIVMDDLWPLQTLDGIFDGLELSIDDYIWIQYDTDWVDDPLMLPKFVDLRNGGAFYAERFQMHHDDFYYAGKTKKLPQLFPFRPREAIWYASNPPIPKYVYNLQYRKDPYITVLDFHGYEQTQNSSALKRWRNPIPSAARNSETQS